MILKSSSLNEIHNKTDIYGEVSTRMCVYNSVFPNAILLHFCVNMSMYLF